MRAALTIGKLADAAGTKLETVRYYERIGLMPPPPRSSSGHRHYDVEHLRRLTFIRRGRERGFGVEQIRALLALAEPAHRSCADVQALALAHLQDIQTKLDDLAKLKSILQQTVSQCSGEVTPTCPVLDMLVASSPPS